MAFKIFILLGALFLITVFQPKSMAALSHIGSGGTPASNVQLSYNVDKQVLHVEADHPSNRLTVNFVRRVIVIKTSKLDPDKPETQEFNFTHQTTAAKFIADLEYKTKEEDHLTVTVYANLGGSASADITIPILPKEKKNVKK